MSHFRGSPSSSVQDELIGNLLFSAVCFQSRSRFFRILLMRFLHRDDGEPQVSILPNGLQSEEIVDLLTALLRLLHSGAHERRGEAPYVAVTTHYTSSVAPSRAAPVLAQK
jgi:hypothetical protein